MKCNSDKVRKEKDKLAQERAEAERKQMLDAMTDEEREAFLQKEKEEHEAGARRAAKHLTELAVLSSTIGGTYRTF